MAVRMNGVKSVVIERDALSSIGMARIQPVSAAERALLVLDDPIEGGDSNDRLDGTAGDDTLNGYAGNDILYGFDGNDLLDGGLGIDAMYGGRGDDLFIVDNMRDRVMELAGEGVDTVRSLALRYILPENVENMVAGLTVGQALIGNVLANHLSGNVGNDILNGGGGADVMAGAAGDDLYYVNDAGDNVIEDEGQGNDSIMSSVTYSLEGRFVETLTLLGTAVLNAYGNDGANILNGNVADNLLMGNGGNDVLNGGIGEDILNGGTGADRMDGGVDNDIYIVDNVGDIVIELPESSRPENSRDEVRTSLARYTLPAEVERLTGTMSSGQTLIGNTMNNRIIGRHGDDIINGGAGTDLMIGGLGNDVYYVDNSGDRMVEKVNGGEDVVKSSVSFSLSGQHIEDLVLMGFGDIDATGNPLANRLFGNENDNDLHGMAGNDVMTGGGGSDRFFFETMLGSSNVDRITDFNVADDTIMLQYPPFKTGSYGELEESRFRIGTAPQDADDRVIYDPASGNLLYDRDGTGMAATILFAQISPGLALTHADFIIF